MISQAFKMYHGNARIRAIPPWPTDTLIDEYAFKFLLVDAPRDVYDYRWAAAQIVGIRHHLTKEKQC